MAQQREILPGGASVQMSQAECEELPAWEQCCGGEEMEELSILPYTVKQVLKDSL